MVNQPHRGRECPGKLPFKVKELRMAGEVYNYRRGGSGRLPSPDFKDLEIWN